MLRSLGQFSSPIVKGLVVLAIGAVLLGHRVERPAAGRRLVPRDLAPARYHAFQGASLPERPHAQLLLDIQTGVVSVPEFPGAKDFDLCSVSPWRDADGEHRVAGRWWGFANDELEGRKLVLGLALGTFPGGRILDRIALDPVPVAPPCWFPDGSDRVLFAAGDGRLYLLSFLAAGGPDGAASAHRPRPVDWATAGPGATACYFRQPCWPSAPALRGHVLVSVYAHDREHLSQTPPGARLWWLKLSPDATEIVAAGRLIDPEGNAIAAADDECHPTVGTTDDGSPMLGYLSGLQSEGTVELRTAPICVAGDSEGGVPRVRAGTVRRMAVTNVLAAPAFSPDGQWIYAAVRDRASGEAHVACFAAAPAESRGSLAE